MRTLHPGDIGPDVATWQEILKVIPDGRFGPKTTAATKQWQQEHGLVADGVVGRETWEAAGVTPAELPPVLKGVDLSSIQGVIEESTWEQLADAGTRFAIMRAIVGNETWVDGSAKANAERATAHGIVAGAYVFAYPLPHLDPVKEAENYVRRLEGMGVPAQLPPALDLEWPPREENQKQPDGSVKLVRPWEKWKCSPGQIRDWIVKCLDRCEALTGTTWMVYSYRYWLKCIEAHLLPELASRPLWLADYSFNGRWPTMAQLQKLSVPAPWSKITIIQHDGDGGLRLPNNRDADFNCLLGGEDTLADLTRSPNRHFALEPVTNATVADYRATRITTETA